MSNLNIYRELLSLLPSSPLLVGQVESVGTGTVTVQYPGGGTQMVRATGYAIGAKVFVRDGVVEGLAPALPTVTIEV
jgi:hypothetical protein